MKESHMLTLLRNAALCLERERCETTASYVRDVIQELETRWNTDSPPPQQESATVVEMRRSAANIRVNDPAYPIKSRDLFRWADELFAAEQNARNLAGTAEALQARVKELEQQAIESEVPISFGQQCYQDRCENAYVEVSVVKMLEEEVASLKEELLPHKVLLKEAAERILELARLLPSGHPSQWNAGHWLSKHGFPSVVQLESRQPAPSQVERVAFLIQEPFRAQWHAFEAKSDATKFRESLRDGDMETPIPIQTIERWTCHPATPESKEKSDGD